MKASRKETEVKLRFPSYLDAVEHILATGAELQHARAFEDNVVFDTADHALARSQRLLRLRSFRERCVLTFKGPAEPDARHKVRPEFESVVNDGVQMRAILEGAGFVPVWRYQKHRSTYGAGGVEISVDETPLGCFVELEGEPAAIDALARELGFGPGDYVLASYRELAEAAAGGVPGDMLVER